MDLIKWRKPREVKTLGGIDQTIEVLIQERSLATGKDTKSGKSSGAAPGLRMSVGLPRCRPSLHYECFRSADFRFWLKMIPGGTASQRVCDRGPQN